MQTFTQFIEPRRAITVRGFNDSVCELLDLSDDESIFLPKDLIKQFLPEFIGNVGHPALLCG